MICGSVSRASRLMHRTASIGRNSPCLPSSAHLQVFVRGADNKRAFEGVVEEIMFVAEINDKGEALHLAKWMLQEEARFDKEGERRKAEYLVQKARRLQN